MSTLISNSSKSRLPFGKLFFVSIKERILGKKYELSLVFCDSVDSQKINKKYRNKNKPTNVLSFPLDEDSGEIFLDLEKTKFEFEDFEMNYKNFIAYLYIHGLLHLKGLDHGDEMEKLEKKYTKEFLNINL
jgi:probable rRNA maturation factor